MSTKHNYPFYHEKQIGTLCAIHAINNILQYKYISLADMNRLSQEARNLEYSKTNHMPAIDEYGVNGAFDAQVIVMAIEKLNISVKRLSPEQVLAAANNNSACAYIIAQRNHFYAVRRFYDNGPLWVCDSLLPEPIIDNNRLLMLYKTQPYDAIFNINLQPTAAATSQPSSAGGAFYTMKNLCDTIFDNLNWVLILLLLIIVIIKSIN